MTVTPGRHRLLEDVTMWAIKTACRQTRWAKLYVTRSVDITRRDGQYHLRYVCWVNSRGRARRNSATLTKDLLTLRMSYLSHLSLYAFCLKLSSDPTYLHPRVGKWIQYSQTKQIEANNLFQPSNCQIQQIWLNFISNNLFGGHSSVHRSLQ